MSFHIDHSACVVRPWSPGRSRVSISSVVIDRHEHRCRWSDQAGDDWPHEFLPLIETVVGFLRDRPREEVEAVLAGVREQGECRFTDPSIEPDHALDLIAHGLSHPGVVVDAATASLSIMRSRIVTEVQEMTRGSNLRFDHSELGDGLPMLLCTWLERHRDGAGLLECLRHLKERRGYRHLALDGPPSKLQDEISREVVSGLALLRTVRAVCGPAADRVAQQAAGDAGEWARVMGRLVDLLAGADVRRFAGLWRTVRRRHAWLDPEADRLLFGRAGDPPRCPERAERPTVVIGLLLLVCCRPAAAAAPPPAGMPVASMQISIHPSLPRVELHLLGDIVVDIEGEDPIVIARRVEAVSEDPIVIARRVEAVSGGDGALLPVEMPAGLFPAELAQYRFMPVDYNFDGYQDIELAWAWGASNRAAWVWIFLPGECRFRFAPEVSGWNWLVDPDRREVFQWERDYEANEVHSAHNQWTTAGQPLPVREETAPFPYRGEPPAVEWLVDNAERPGDQ